MREIFREETVQVSAGKEFSAGGASLTVDGNGNPTKAFYDSPGPHGGGFESGPSSTNFQRCVELVMYTILEEDVNEFREMRDSLNLKYRELAESLRKAKTSKYDF